MYASTYFRCLEGRDDFAVFRRDVILQWDKCQTLEEYKVAR